MKKTKTLPVAEPAIDEQNEQAGSPPPAGDPPVYPPTPTLPPEQPETAPQPPQPETEPERQPEPETEPAPVGGATLQPAPVTATAAPALNGTRYFKKVSANMPLYVDKVRVPFEVLDQNFGVLKTSDHRTIEVLEDFHSKRTGGVVPIDEDTYSRLKKKFPFKPSVSRFQQPREKLRLWQSKPKKLSPAVSANAAAVGGDIRRAPQGVPAAKVAGDVAAAGTAATFSPNLKPKSGVLKTPASGKFRSDYVPPILPPKV